MNKELEKYFVMADTIQETYGSTCEVIIHDLTEPKSSVVHVANGNVTGRKVGQSFDHLVKQVLLNKDFKNDHLSNYFFKTTDEKAIKSSSALIRNQEDEVIGMLCINIDISMLQGVNTMLMDFLKLDPENGKNSEMEEQDVPQDVMAIIDKLILSVIGTTDTRGISRAKCVELIRFMDEKGIFLVKGAMDKVAELMGVSRVTIYSYLDEARGKKGKA